MKTFGAREECGYNSGKKIKGCKRHIAVDTLDNLIQAIVHAVNAHDTKAA